jgi:uridine kinase
MENPIEIAVSRSLALPSDKPLRIGVDGRSAAGKTTFADALSKRLQRAGRTVLRAGIDDFHPRFFSRSSAAPLDSGGNRQCRLGVHDSYTDTPIDRPAVEVPGDAIVVIDGGLLLRFELRRYWEFVIWLDVSFETMIERAAKRDIAWMPSEAAVRARYRDSWIPLHLLHEL